MDFKKCIVHLTDGTSCHGKPYFFRIFTQVPTFLLDLWKYLTEPNQE